MNKWLVLLLILINTGVQAQTFWKRYSTSQMRPYSVLTPDDGLIISSNGTENNLFVPNLMRINSAGDIVWSAQFSRFPDTVNGTFNKVIQTVDGNYAAVGDIGIGTHHGIALHKFSIDGITIWSKILEMDSCPQHTNVDAANVIELKDKGFVVSGLILVSGNFQMFLMKTDSMGNPEWMKTYEGPNYYYGVNYNLCQDADSGFVFFQPLAGVTQDGLLLHVDKAGNLIWSATLDSTNHYKVNGIYNFDGQVYLTFNSGFAKTNLDSNIFLMKVYPHHFYLDYKSMGKCDNSDFIFTFYIGPSTNYTFGIQRTDSLGNIKWIRKFDLDIRPILIRQLSHGGLIFQGGSYDDSLNISYTEVILFDSSGNIGCHNDTISIVTDSTYEKFSSFPIIEHSCMPIVYVPNYQTHSTGASSIVCPPVYVEQINKTYISFYPNPTTGIIRFTSEKPISKIFITNILGERIFQTKYSQDLNLSSLPKGIYFLTAVFVNGEHQITRIVLI